MTLRAPDPRQPIILSLPCAYTLQIIMPPDMFEQTFGAWQPAAAAMLLPFPPRTTLVSSLDRRRGCACRPVPTEGIAWHAYRAQTRLTSLHIYPPPSSHKHVCKRAHTHVHMHTHVRCAAAPCHAQMGLPQLAAQLLTYSGTNNGVSVDHRPSVTILRPNCVAAKKSYMKGAQPPAFAFVPPHIQPCSKIALQPTCGMPAALATLFLLQCVPHWRAASHSCGLLWRPLLADGQLVKAKLDDVKEVLEALGGIKSGGVRRQHRLARGAPAAPANRHRHPCTSASLLATSL